MKQIAIFASGTGSNARKIIEHFKDSSFARVSLIVCNNPKAGVIGIAAANDIPLLMIEKQRFKQTGYVGQLQKHNIDLIVLAGFLWMIPPPLLDVYPNKVINIHPALLPDFGGKGMYGASVHQAVIASGNKESGITIHFVDDKYDHGKVIFQAKCEVSTNDDADTLAEKIHKLEHLYFANVIEEILRKA